MSDEVCVSHLRILYREETCSRDYGSNPSIPSISLSFCLT